MCVSSLAAIMMDQKSKFTPRGLVTELVGETQDYPAAVKRVVEGKVQLVFISPENSERHSLSKHAADAVQKLVPLVVDEAHCIKTWYL